MAAYCAILRFSRRARAFRAVAENSQVLDYTIKDMGTRKENRYGYRCNKNSAIDADFFYALL